MAAADRVGPTRLLLRRVPVAGLDAYVERLMAEQGEAQDSDVSMSARDSAGSGG